MVYMHIIIRTLRDRAGKHARPISQTRDLEMHKNPPLSILMEVAEETGSSISVEPMF